MVGAANAVYLCAIPERDGVELANQRLVPPLADDRDACYQALNQVAEIEVLFLVLLLHCLLLESSKLRHQAASNGTTQSSRCIWLLLWSSRAP